MKHRRLIILLCAACIALFAGALVACRQSVLTLDDIYEQGYDCEVVFDLAGGVSGERGSGRERTELHQYVKKDSLIVKPGTDKNEYSGKAPVLEGYTFGGYYRGEKAADGTIEYDFESGKWDFAKDKVKENLTLYAYWRENYKVVVHYKDGEGKAVTAEIVVPQSEDGVADAVNTPAVPGYTVIAYFADQATADEALLDDTKDSERLSFPVAGDMFTEQTRTWDVYANALAGTFTVIREQSEFKNFYEGENIYLMTDIDFGNEAVNVFPSNYAGTFYGNNHTISNFKLSRETAQFRDGYLGIFQGLGATAVLQDITFSGFTLTMETKNPDFYSYIGALAGRALEGAVIRNVTLSGTLNCTLAQYAEGHEPTISEFIADVPASGVTVEGCHYDDVVINQN